jgi:guanylate kinase
MIVAPSGAGKSSLVNALLEADHSLQLSLSCTTRAPTGWGVRWARLLIHF